MLHDGDVLELPTLQLTDYGHISQSTAVEEWTVLSDYENFVLCERNGVRQCFTHAELIQLGYARQDEVHEVMRAERSRHWSPFKAGDNYKRKYDDTEVEE